MHELGITKRILEIALQHAEEGKAHRVTDIHLTVGSLASVVDDSVQFYWDIISKDTLAHHATLHFRRIEAELICRSCDRRFTPDGRSFDCPFCNGQKVVVYSGEEFFVDAIDVVQCSM
jgi:hydrogenase nickel incorporation protein HypA/HybF